LEKVANGKQRKERGQESGRRGKVMQMAGHWEEGNGRG